MGACDERRAPRPLAPAGVVLAAAIAAALAAGCVKAPAALSQVLEARRLASELHVEFTKAAEASNRAVMAETDEASAGAAKEARHARQIVERDADALRPLLHSLAYRDDLRRLDGFNSRYQEYRRIDDEILPLSLENTNLKAQRLSFGAAREAADGFRVALEAAVASGVKDALRAEAIAAKARIALLEIQVLYAPHIAESEDAAMTRMEHHMAASEAAARKALEELKQTAGSAVSAHVADAAAALDRYMKINKEIVALSRRNSDVRSLALSLGRKRTVTAECEDQLRALEDTLAKHKFTATR